MITIAGSFKYVNMDFHTVNFSDACLLRHIGFKKVVHIYTVETKLNDKDLRGLFVLRYKFCFSSSKSESCVGVSAASELLSICIRAYYINPRFVHKHPRLHRSQC